jgi:cysteine desulfurase
MNPEIYADHAATTRPAPEVVEAMRPYFAGGFGNASSVHRRGEAARAAIDHARSQVAALLGATPEEIVFTASGSEANVTAIRGAVEAAPPGRRRVVVSAIEHPSVLETARQLAAAGVPVTVVPVDAGGCVDPDAVSRAVGPDTALVSVMWVNNEVGTIQPVAEIARRAHAAGAKFHCDAVQAAGRIAIDVAREDIDLLAIAGHKLRGPLGAAALYVRRRTRLVPLVPGGHQERSRRAGTENLPAIVGFGVAATLAAAGLAAGRPVRVAGLGERLVDAMLARIPGARLNGHRDRRVGSIANLCLPGVDGEAMLHGMDRAGVTISTGSACSAATPGPSHVLLAMGLRSEDAHASIRVSLGEEHGPEHVERIVEAAASVAADLRRLGETPGERGSRLAVESDSVAGPVAPRA